jgi:hypothetical protein
MPHWGIIVVFTLATLVLSGITTVVKFKLHLFGDARSSVGSSGAPPHSPQPSDSTDSSVPIRWTDVNCSNIPSLPTRRHFMELNESEGRRPALLWSFPGSGNTWSRLLIELATGVFTGSVFNDQGLVQGLPGELRCDATVSAIKLHWASGLENLYTPPQFPPHETRSHKCAPLHAIRARAVLQGSSAEATFPLVILVRDPFAAFVAEFQRDAGKPFWAPGTRGHDAVILRDRLPDLLPAWLHMLPRRFARRWQSECRAYLQYLRSAEEKVGTRAGADWAPAALLLRYEDLRGGAGRSGRERRWAALRSLIDTVAVPGVTSSGLTDAALDCVFAAAASSAHAYRPKPASAIRPADLYDAQAVEDVWGVLGECAQAIGYQKPTEFVDRTGSPLATLRASQHAEVAAAAVNRTHKNGAV